MNQAILQKVEKEICELEADAQRTLLCDLPRLLRISQEDILYLKTAEPSFDFWNNPEDRIYDDL